jgi:purine nucleosidase
MRLIIDTDPAMGTAGTDPEDGMAILYALNSPEVTVEGITLVQGNVPISQSWPNTVHLLDLAGRADVALHAGAPQPRDPERRRMQVAWLAQRAGMATLLPDRAVGTGEARPETAANFIAETVTASPGQITVVAIGPLTNLAAALEADPSVAEDLAGLVIMGGTVEVPGNITPAAEFNIWMDPEAADVVFRSGVPITMVGLDVCHQTQFDRDQAAGLASSGSPLATFVGRTSESWIEVRETLFDGDDAHHLYDTLAMAAAIEPDLLEYRPALVDVETSTGPAQAMTVTYLNDIIRQLLTGRDHNARVAVGVDVDRFAQRFHERVISQL